MKKWDKNSGYRPSPNPLNNIDLSPFLNPKKSKEKEKENFKSIQKEYERILHKEIQKENKAYRVIFDNHPELLFVTFCRDRGAAKWQAAKYFKSIFNPFFTGENYRTGMLYSHAYRCAELDKYALEGKVPIPELLRVLDVSIPCSVCGKYDFTYSDYEKVKCFIVEGEGDSNPFTKGYILCTDCYKKYMK